MSHGFRPSLFFAAIAGNVRCNAQKKLAFVSVVLRELSKLPSALSEIPPGGKGSRNGGSASDFAHLTQADKFVMGNGD
jgi:hypothetical protein